MLCRFMAFCGLVFLCVAGGFAARAQSTIAQIPDHKAVASQPLKDGDTAQPPKAAASLPKPSPTAPEGTADQATKPAINAPISAPASAAGALPAVQVPADKVPKAAVSSPAVGATRAPGAAATAPASAKAAPVVVEAPMPLPKPAALTGQGQGSPAELPATRPSLAAWHIPTWLKPHVGLAEGKIAPVVLERAHALHQQKVSEGRVKNSCYFAMDATRPNDLGDGKLGRRFYVICEASRMFRAIAAGHGGGRHLKGIVNFRNGRRCAKNFSNAMDSKLTAGGDYVTGETRTSFEGYYRVSAHKDAALIRSFIQFDGQGETANARQRAIGGHAAVLLRRVCLRKDPGSSHANADGYVRFGKLVNYAGGRSNGCTSWSRQDARHIVAMVKDDPTTLYIYPDAADIDAVAHAVKAGRSLSHAGLYWSASCLKDIHSPKFWSKKTLGPILARYKKDHPAPSHKPPPFCKASVVSAKN